MTAILPVLIGSVFIILIVAAILWPSFKSRRAKKPLLSKELPFFAEEYSEELTGPVKQQVMDHVPELPCSYGMDRMVLMVRDPYWLYAYWEVTATRMDEMSAHYGPQTWGESRTVLRIYDVTGVDFNGNNANSTFDCSLNRYSDQWYINVPEANRTYCVDLGRILPDGRFITILRSNLVTTPRDNLSDRLDEEWMWIEGLYLRHQMGISSPLILEEINERMGRLPLGISSPGFYDPADEYR